MDLVGLGIELFNKRECVCGRVHRIPIKKVLVEKEAVGRIPSLVKELGLSGTACVVVDGITKKVAGDVIIDLLLGHGLKAVEAVIASPTLEAVEEAKGLMEGCGYAIAVGGGSVIDTCKLASHKASIPFISVPTALSQDGLASPTASIIAQGRIRRSFPASPPIAVVVDTEVVGAAPKRMLASGCGDMLAKATSLKDWELGRDEKGEYYCPSVAMLSLSAFEEAAEFIRGGMRDLAKLAQALIKSSLSMAAVGSSRPSSGSEHLFSHYLDINASSPALHGEQVGIGTVLMSVYHSEHNAGWWHDDKFQGPAIRELLNKAGAPTTLSQLGIEEELAVKALCEGYRLRPDRYTIVHKRPMAPSEARALLRKAQAI